MNLKRLLRSFLISAYLLMSEHLIQPSFAQLLTHNENFTAADSLRGSLNPNRTWWDVNHYAIHITPHFKSGSIKGSVVIRFRVLEPAILMQLDLQKPMLLDSAIWRGQKLEFEQEGNVALIKFPTAPARGGMEEIMLSFRGQPHKAIKPPWDGGWIFRRDDSGRPWMGVASQGIGSSTWLPCKDHQSDEADSISFKITVPSKMVAVANGQLREVSEDAATGFSTFHWVVQNPINTYTIVPYIGSYVHWYEEIKGEKGKLKCDFWVLDYDLQESRTQFQQVEPVLKCFEHWFGPYPFYEDGFKLVESPYAGMENQSAIAYGFQFGNNSPIQNPYNAEPGKSFDYMIVHEGAHEWFGNSITTNDIADMWVHEAFATYAEVLYKQWQEDELAAYGYLDATRKYIGNQNRIIGVPGVNSEGSQDMYHKGANVVHMIRQLFNNDELFRSALREMNRQFYHKTVDSKDIELFWSSQLGIDLSSFFDQYLRTVQVPKLEYRINKTEISYRWVNCNDSLSFPVKIFVNKKFETWITPTTSWTTKSLDLPLKSIQADPNFYISVKKAD